jgi:hypothetical protein
VPFPAAPCFLLEQTDRVRRGLRRYSDYIGQPGGWTCEAGWHEAIVPIEDGDAIWSERDGGGRTYRGDADLEDYANDPRWPVNCEKGCGYEFSAEDTRQVFSRLIYRVAAVVPGAALEPGAETTLRDAPPGAMWWATWMPTNYRGFDGRALVAKLPNGSDWPIDMEATNCTRKGDRTHRCWLRHGDPPFVTVDKSGGETCAAGAGSIMSGEGEHHYHGFLQQGILTAG